MNEPLTIEQIMRNTPKVFNAEAAEGVEAVVQFHFTGDEASDWYITIANGACTVEEGTTDNPRMSMTVDSQVYIDIISGKTNAMQAFMSGKVRVTGDMAMAMKFPNYFKTRG